MNISDLQKPWLRKLAALKLAEAPTSAWENAREEWRKVGRGLGAQAEGFYSLKPKYITGEIAPGISRQSLPQAVAHFAKHPLRATQEAWRIMGHAEGVPTGLHIPAGKWFPRFLRTGVPAPAWYPSLERLFMAAEIGRGTYKALTDEQRRGAHIGRTLGSVGGWVVGRRLPGIPMLASTIGGGALGRAIGGLYDKAVGRKGVQDAE